MNLIAGELADVLLVEDDPGDALLIEESFGPAEVSNRRCHVASHSDQALRFVRRTGEFTDAPRQRDTGCARPGLPVLRRAYALAGLGAFALRCVLSGPSPRAAANGQPAIEIPAAVMDDPGRGAGPG